MTGPLLDWPALKSRRIVGSRATLHRALRREVSDNPFPAPLRHTVTGRRYWPEAGVLAWVERERARGADSVRMEDLAPDTDPGRWAPPAMAAGRRS